VCYSATKICTKVLNVLMCQPVISISRDVVFDKNIFSFAKLHPNAGARLRFEILLLSPSLIPLELLHNGVNNLDEPVANFTNSANKKMELLVV
jgi:hypothetical protein